MNLKELLNENRKKCLKHAKNKNGLSLIVLIVTVIIVIILAAAVIITMTKNSPIGSAREAKFKSDVRTFQDDLAITISEEYTRLQGQRDKKITARGYEKDETKEEFKDSVYKYIPSFTKEYERKFIIVDDKLVAVGLEEKEKEWANSIGIIIKEEEKEEETKEKLTLTELLKDKNKYIGDFVNYDAGEWQEGEIENIKTGKKGSEVVASVEEPTLTYQFGGFPTKNGRNGSAIPYSADYSYVKDKTTGEAVEGWRIFDITDDGIVLISAGCSENYNMSDDDNEAYYSEYILTGNINSKATDLGISEDTFTKRDWSMYKNDTAKEVKPITKEILDNWYSSVIGIENADTYTQETFKKIYLEQNSKKANLIDNFSFYWLASSYEDYSMFYVNPKFECLSANVFSFGIRLLVYLNEDINLNKTGDKKTVIDGDGNEYEYNVWGI